MESVEETRIRLEKLKIGLQHRVSSYLLSPKVLVDYESSLIDEIGIAIKGFIWAEQIERIEIKYPLNWWEAFKDRWFADWMLKRWPVKYKVEVIDVKTLYPNFRPSIPNEASFLALFRSDNLEE